ncbi:MAG: adenylosuccinate lyase [Candidatus Eisenbacteria bacterium]|nr:adenylosuccinate lyase [Candidatus Latescibacterota bacterium]MBD3302718.1 adenylosuccinate lyase [Candidatus Eisenbacteria bacterium]
MIPRYTRERMGALFSDSHRFQVWLEVELAHLETLEEVGIAPSGTAAAVRGRAEIRIERIDELEATLHHDVIAFLTSISERLGPERKWLHWGMTSSDLVDTAQAVLLDRAVALLRRDWEALGAILRRMAVTHRDVVMVGRTHGVHAEPITFGLKALGWFAEAHRQAERIERAHETIRRGKLSGAVGTGAHLSPAIERKVLARLGLEPETVATQVVPRDRHAHLLNVLAGAAATCERIAVEIRHLQRTEVREVQEPFGKGQKGSSSMPHKRNPILCERISGLARLMRGYAATGLENVALWHERDISHSSVERITLADSCILLDYMIDRMRFVLDGLVVRPDAMRANLERTGGLIFSQKVLLALTDALGDRERAYRIVQTHAMATWEEGGSFRDRLRADPEVARAIDDDRLDAIFDLDRFLVRVPEIFDVALAVDWGRE